MNRVALIGRVASDIQYIPCNKDRSVRRFALAFRDKIKKNGEEDTYFIECEAWDSVGERFDKYVEKGDRIAIDGRLIQNKYERADGSKSSKIVVVVSSVEFLEYKKKSEEQSKQEEDKEKVEDDDLPF